MTQVINSNILSLTAQRNLNQSQGALQQSIQRLSSGLRINSARDDAAGLAISERFTAQIRGLNQAQRNANDGISFAQTAEGALSTVNDNLQRIRELAVQAANETNSVADRQSINNEVSQLIAEVNRVSEATEFNGQKILDGSASSLTFQVGANQGQTITVSGVDARGSQLGAAVGTGNTIVTSDLQTDADAGETLTINGVDVDLSDANVGGVADVDALIDAINLVANDSGVQAQKATSTSTGALAYTADADDARTLTINNVDITIAAGATDQDVVDAVNDVATQTGVTATLEGANSISFANTSGSDIAFEQDADVTTGGVSLFAGANPNAAGAAGTETFQAGVVLSADVGENPTITSTGTLSFTGLDAASGAFADNVLSDVNVLTTANATAALQTIDFALAQSNGLRAELGAIQTRFENTITNLETTSENLSAARSRIRDADFAAETAALTRAQILQQAGISALSQANSQPQSVLALLQ